jgi:hypothetical protein
MKHLTHFVILSGAVLLVGCTTLKPKDYGFRQVALSGQDYYCAPREWVVPPVVPQEAANDPLFPLYTQFLALPETDVVSDAHPPTREVCITQAQWPQWLTMRTKWNRDWAVTPGTAEALAAQRTSGQ